MPIKKAIDIFSWLIFFSICGLTLVVYVSQNSIPGDTTFPVKLGFEKVLVKTSRLLNNESTIQIEFTKRRIDEARKVLASNDAQVANSLTNLTNQVNDTEKAIMDEKNPQKQQELAKTYISTLNIINISLEQEKEKKVENYSNPTTNQENSVNNENIISNQVQPTEANVGGPELSPTQATNNYKPLEQKIYSDPTPTTYIKPTEKVTVTVNNYISPTIIEKKNFPTPTSSSTPTNTSVQTQTAVIAQISQTQESVNNAVQNLSNIVEKKKNEDKNEKDNKKKSDSDSK